MLIMFSVVEGGEIIESKDRRFKIMANFLNNSHLLCPMNKQGGFFQIFK